MPTTPWSALPQVCPHSWSPRVTNLLYFQARSQELQSPQSRPIYAVQEARAALTWTATRNQLLANQHWTPAPDYQVGQEVWLSSGDLPLHTDSHKLAPRYNAPYVAEHIINPIVVRLPPASTSCLYPSFFLSGILCAFLLKN